MRSGMQARLILHARAAGEKCPTSANFIGSGAFRQRNPCFRAVRDGREWLRALLTGDREMVDPVLLPALIVVQNAEGLFLPVADGFDAIR